MSADLSEAVTVWRQTAEAYRARCDFLEAELQRLKRDGAGAPQTESLDTTVEAVIARYSFGNPSIEAAHRTFARTQIAAGADPMAVAALIRRGGYDAEDSAA